MNGPAGTPDARRRWVVLTALSVPVFVGALDLTVVSAVLPAVTVELRIPLQSGLDDAAWAVSGYLLAYALGILAMGRASDVVGRRTALVAALAVFFAGSWWVAASDALPARVVAAASSALGAGSDDAFLTLHALVVGRVAQGFGAGALVPVSMAVAADLFPVARRAIPLGIIGAVDTAGWALGHLYGGVVVQRLPWQTLFWVNLPIAAAAIALVRRLVPAGAVGGRFDWQGALAVLVALLAANAAIGGNESLSPASFPDRAPAYAGPLLLAAVLALGLFVVRQRTAASPLLDLAAFRERPVAAASAANLVAGGCLMVALVSVPLLVNAAGARTPLEGALVSGVLLSALTLPMAVAALVGGLVATGLGYRIATVAAFVAALAGFAVMTDIRPNVAADAVAWLIDGAAPSDAVARLVAGLALAGVGLGLATAPLAATVLDAADPRYRGGAAALVLVLRLAGMAAATSAMTTYGLRRAATLGPHILAGTSPLDIAAVAEANRRLTAQVTAEMFALAALACVAALFLAPLLPARRPR